MIGHSACVTGTTSTGTGIRGEDDVSRKIPVGFHRSLHVRHVDAGSCNGCESELQALNNPFYNLHRLGVFFTASPRFADVLLVTGPVTHAMRDPLLAAYEAMPEPRWVMAIGTCAVAGGTAGGGEFCAHGLDGILPVDIYLPGCPPNPAAMIEAFMLLLGRKRQRVIGGAMATDFSLLVPVLFTLALVVSLMPHGAGVARVLLAAGAIAGVVLCCMDLPAQSLSFSLPFGPDRDGTHFSLDANAAWLLGFGFAASVPVFIAGPNTTSRRAVGVLARQWGCSAPMVSPGLQDGMSFLVAYEVMSLGGAVMIMADRRTEEAGRPVLFMLAILEAGAVALLLAYLILTTQSGSPDFSTFTAATQVLPDGIRMFTGILLLIGFGAKIGIIPFYEWFPDAYGAASGATGALMSGIILNAAFFALGRALLAWFRLNPGTMLMLGILLVAVGVISAVLSALYAFQQESWRRLLAFSSAENGSVAIALLGASSDFRPEWLRDALRPCLARRADSPGRAHAGQEQPFLGRRWHHIGNRG